MTSPEGDGGTEERSGCTQGQDLGEAGKVLRTCTPRWPWPSGTTLGLHDPESRRLPRVGALGPRVCLPHPGPGPGYVQSDTGWGSHCKTQQCLLSVDALPMAEDHFHGLYWALPSASPGLVPLWGAQGRCPQGGDLAQFSFGPVTLNSHRCSLPLPINKPSTFLGGCSRGNCNGSKFFKEPFKWEAPGRWLHPPCS